MNRHVGHWMTRSLLCARPDMPLFEALETMAERGVRHVVVKQANDEELAGIVSNRDIVRSTLTNPEHKLDLHGCTVGEVMTPAPLRTTTPLATIGQAAEIMHEYKISALPVLEDGRLAGLITVDDILAAVSLGEQFAGRPNL